MPRGTIHKIDGILNWSPELHFHVVVDGGGYWLVDLPSRMRRHADTKLYDRVTVEGVRTGFNELLVTSFFPPPVKPTLRERLELWRDRIVTGG